jgi:hypothetical protein
VTPLLTLPRKLRAHFSLLRRDPERFARNLTQFTHPALFEERLLDVLDAVPMHVRLDPALDARPSLNVLNSALTPTGMTGGPNTIINLALRIARLGVPVRLVTTVTSSSITPDWFARHAKQLVGGEVPEVPIVTAAEPAKPMSVGAHDLFLATHWTTAQQLKPVLKQMAVRQFFYMLQEFEPAFYSWSSNYALALETLGLDFWPVFNESLLAEYMLGQPIGRLADPATRERGIIFEPAIDEALFHPGPPEATETRPKRLLFYARPSNTRNLFGLAVMALRAASADPAFAGWEFLSIGGRGSVPPLPLPGGHVLRPAPWMDYHGYARSLREADLLLCPMLSPHTSYPVLEMAASGGLAVTNSFATKTEAALARLSDNIIAVPPTVEGFAAGLARAATAVNRCRTRPASLRMPRDWAAALDPVAERIAAIVRTAAAKGAPAP